MANWKNIFEESRRSSPLCVGREKISTSVIINIPFTLKEIDIVDKNDGTSFCVITTDEYPDKYIFGGRYVTTRFQTLMDVAGMTLKEFNQDISDGSFKMRLITRTSNNKNAQGTYNVYTDMEVL